MKTPRRSHTAPRMGNGQVLVAGGDHDATGILTSCAAPGEVTRPDMPG